MTKMLGDLQMGILQSRGTKIQLKKNHALQDRQLPSRQIYRQKSICLLQEQGQEHPTTRRYASTLLGLTHSNTTSSHRQILFAMLSPGLGTLQAGPVQSYKV